MYVTLSKHTDQPITAWRIESDQNSIWFGVPGASYSSVTFAEAQQLVAELTRELAAVEAAARVVSA